MLSSYSSLPYGYRFVKNEIVELLVCLKVIMFAILFFTKLKHGEVPTLFVVTNEVKTIDKCDGFFDTKLPRGNG